MDTVISWKKNRKPTGGRGLKLTRKQESLLLFVRYLQTHYEHDLLTLNEIIEFLPTSLKMPDSTLSYNLSKLKEYGLIEGKIKGEYVLSAKGKKVLADILKHVSIVGKRLRPHKIQIVFTLFYPPSNLNEVRELCVPISNGKYHGLMHTIEDTVICFYGRKKIVALVEGYHSETIPQVYELAEHQYIQPLIKYVEDFFKVKVDRSQTKIHVDHIALIGTRMAKLAQESNFRYVSDLFHIDNSGGVPEGETVGKNAVENLETLMPFIEKLEKKLREEENGNSGNISKNKVAQSDTKDGEK